MPLKVIPLAEAETKFRQARKTALETLEEWRDLKVQLSAGIKPNSAIVVELPKNSKIKNLRSTFKRRSRNYVRKLQLGYEVRGMKDSSGTEVVIISNHSDAPASPPPSRKR